MFLRDRLRAFLEVFDTIDPRHRPRVLELISERMDLDHWDAVHDDPLLDRRTRDFLLSLHGSKIATARRTAWLATRWCYRAVRGRLS